MFLIHGLNHTGMMVLYQPNPLDIDNCANILPYFSCFHPCAPVYTKDWQGLVSIIVFGQPYCVWSAAWMLLVNFPWPIVNCALSTAVYTVFCSIKYARCSAHKCIVLYVTVSDEHPVLTIWLLCALQTTSSYCLVMHKLAVHILTVLCSVNCVQFITV